MSVTPDVWGCTQASNAISGDVLPVTSFHITQTHHSCLMFPGVSGTRLCRYSSSSTCSADHTKPGEHSCPTLLAAKTDWNTNLLPNLIHYHVVHTYVALIQAGLLYKPLESEPLGSGNSMLYSHNFVGQRLHAHGVNTNRNMWRTAVFQ
jgi:hypothetical protein